MARSRNFRIHLLLAVIALGAALLLVSPPRASACALCDTYSVVGVEFGDVLYLRSKPSAKASIVAAIPYDGVGIIKAGGCAGNWCRMNYNGKVGWVNMKFLHFVDGK